MAVLLSHNEQNICEEISEGLFSELDDEIWDYLFKDIKKPYISDKVDEILSV